MLASIQIINDIIPITEADFIEEVKVLGYRCIVKNGIFKIADPCIFIETDAIIPKCFLTEKEIDVYNRIRITNMKIKGRLSQGLVLPLNAPGEEEVESLYQAMSKVYLEEHFLKFMLVIV